MFYYLNIFFIFSFLGFLMENIFSLIGNTTFNSGILYGPWTFIYGFAIFVLMFVDKFLRKRKMKKWLEILVFFVISIFLMSFIEFLGGFLIEKLFHVVYWDYTNMKFNIGYYICLEAAVFWGVFATLVNYLLVPVILKFEKKIPRFVTIVFVILFVIDIIATIIN